MTSDTPQTAAGRALLSEWDVDELDLITLVMRMRERVVAIEREAIALERKRAEPYVVSLAEAAATAQQAPAIDVLREAVWEANKNNGWGEAVDTTDRMAAQIAAELAARLTPPGAQQETKLDQYARQSREAAAEIATWPAWMQRNLVPPTEGAQQGAPQPCGHCGPKGANPPGSRTP